MCDNICKIGLYIGRFQPLHNGHLNIILEGLNNSDKFIVVIGSIDKCDDKNILTYEERSNLITKSTPNHLIHKLAIIGLKDSDKLEPIENVRRSELWYYHLKNTLCTMLTNKKPYQLNLYASAKDEQTLDYLQKITNVLNISNYVHVPTYKTKLNQNLDATAIRDKYSELRKECDKFFDEIKDIVPPSSLELLKNKLIL